MKYAHILMAVAAEYWAIDEAKFDQIVAFLALQASGDKYSAEEVQARINRQAERDVARREGSVAVLPFRGVLGNRMSMMGDISGGTSYESFGRTFDSALNDNDVKAIILDTESPGGVVNGVDELSQKIFAARGRKPIIAHVNAYAASAAYWTVTAADEVVLNPSAEVGSIGVMQVHDDVSAALEKAGIKRTLLSVGKYKGEGAPFQPLSDDAREHRMRIAQHYYDSFVGRVASNRGVSVKTVTDSFGQGRMVTAADAVSRGMADRIATLDETIARFAGPAPVKSSRAFARERERRALDF
ncbi:S49 family peptidase [Rhizobium binae]|uniref:S49 family peptidase n=1 Tax=Rhizobium binae TaxID=1138190 RepID=UPI001C830BCE|nr:S49 family peptidase [Rhizobium binae]MBX4944630.1 S49 family peptidase [Rhizobium binae]MBX4980661.1 S49 family peptidase [Rhizobium binae]